MRPDMAKVLTDRPRDRRWYRYHDFRRRPQFLLDEDGNIDDAGHLGEGMRAAATRASGCDRKIFSDHIAPLKRFLRSQVGRPWDKVKSEIAQIVPKDSTTHLHLWDHVRREVTEGCYKQEGVIYYPNGTVFHRLKDASSYTSLYVLADGILRKTQDPKHALPNVPRPRDFIRVSQDKVAVLWDGIWYDVSEIRDLQHMSRNAIENEDLIDAFVGRIRYNDSVWEWMDTPHGRHRIVALTKRTMSKKEKKRLGC